MSKPGIIDPWRQEPPPAPPVQKGRIEEPTPDEERQERCIVFSGPRAGVNVWVDAADDDAEVTAQKRIKSLFVQLKALKQPAVDRAVGQYNVNVEHTSFAIRKALVASPQAAALIARHRIKAFVR